MRYKIIHHFLSAEECEQLIELAKPRLIQSTTWNVEKGESQYTDYRQSEQMFFNGYENDLIRLIEDRIADVTKIPVQNGEGLQLVHYNVGGHYKPHYDYFDPAFVGNQSVMNRGGQRVATVIMYLNFVEAGGETYFPNVDVNIQPEQGKALIWFNVAMIDGQAQVDASTYHEAKPVVKGEKFIMTKWLRDKQFR